jgi:1,2-phenylacetyl-CoA epoxidase catalytic subunit
LQTTSGAGQASEHLPATQLALPAPSGQWLPHAPQLSASLSSATQTLPQAL